MKIKGIRQALFCPAEKIKSSKALSCKIILQKIHSGKQVQAYFLLWQEQMILCKEILVKPKSWHGICYKINEVYSYKVKQEKTGETNEKWG